MSSVSTSESCPDVQLPTSLSTGSSGPKVRLVQEWLSLQGIGLALDGVFGPATEAAVRKFQTSNALDANGVVDSPTFRALSKPMIDSLVPIDPAGHSIGSLTLAYAIQHLASHPREIGGQNMGPWVRLYMNGNQGAAWPWCAGFVCFCLKIACSQLNKPTPFSPSFSCTYMASSADHNGILLRTPDSSVHSNIKPGSIFLLEQTTHVWQHTGIVSAVGKDHFETIEGNTNDDGSPEGYEVCARIRGFKRMDFIVIA